MNIEEQAHFKPGKEGACLKQNKTKQNPKQQQKKPQKQKLRGVFSFI